MHIARDTRRDAKGYSLEFEGFEDTFYLDLPLERGGLPTEQLLNSIVNTGCLGSRSLGSHSIDVNL